MPQLQTSYVYGTVGALLCKSTVIKATCAVDVRHDEIILIAGDVIFRAGGASASGAAAGAAATGFWATVSSIAAPVLVVAGIICVMIGIASLFKGGASKVRYRDASKTKSSVCKLTEKQKRDLQSSKNISIKCLHVSCRSDRPASTAEAAKWYAIGVILYAFDGKTMWTMNGVRCRSGYIIIKSSDEVKKARKSETLHRTCFKMVFGKYPNELGGVLIAGGFSVQNGECVFNSGSLNIGGDGDSIHFGTNVMNPVEQCIVAHATKRWIDSRIQNTKISEIDELERGMLCVHPDALAGKGKKVLSAVAAAAAD
jgi:hypothetical protein